MVYRSDKFFQKGQDSSLPGSFVEQGYAARLINSRVSNGSIKPAFHWAEQNISFEEGQVTYEKLNPLLEPNNRFPIRTGISWEELFCKGKLQGAKGVTNLYGRFIIFVIGGVIYRYDIDTCEMCRVFGPHPCFDSRCRRVCMETIGGWVIIANWPNLPVLVGPDGARFTNPNNNEIGAVRIIRLSGGRLYAVHGANDLIISDPYGGNNNFAPLTFEETFLPGPFYRDAYKLGSSLTSDYIVGLCPVVVRGAATQEFDGNLIVAHAASGEKYNIDTTSPRETWLTPGNSFINNGSAGDTMAGCRSCVQSEYDSIFISNAGRFRSLSTQRDSESGLVENYLDDPLGRFDTQEKGWPIDESYSELPHEISPIERFRTRIYAGVSPTCVVGIDYTGEELVDYADMALATASMDSTTSPGERSELSWEGFNTEVHPKELIKFDDNDIFCLSWENCKNVLRRLDFTQVTRKPSRVYTRGYSFISQNQSIEIEPLELSLFISDNPQDLRIEVSYCLGMDWCEWGSMVICDQCCSKKRIPVRMGQPVEEGAGLSTTLQLRITISGGDFCLDEIQVKVRIVNSENTQNLGQCIEPEYVLIEDNQL